MYRVFHNRSAGTLMFFVLCSSAQAASGDHEWAGILSASVGTDDNITQEDNTSATASGLKDNYFELLGSASRYISGVRNDGLRISGTLFSRQYNNESDYDFSLFGVGLGYDKTLSDWIARFNAGYDHITYGGETYQQVTKLGVEGRRHLTKDTQLRLRYEANSIDASETYSSLNGTRQYIRAETRIKQGKQRFRLSYTYQTNDREDSSTATSFSSDSPNRHIIRANARFRFSSNWKSEIDVRYRMSRYQDSEKELVGGELVETITREDNRFRARLGIDYKLAKKTKLFGRYDHYDNDSNIASKSYTRNLVSVGVKHTF